MGGSWLGMEDRADKADRTDRTVEADELNGMMPEVGHN
jgi:hypothetical protein